jgi:hypothetical protein
MGLFDSYSPAPDNLSSSVTVPLGREAFKYFHNQSSKYDAYNNMTQDQALNIVASYGRPHVSDDLDAQKVSIFLDGLGTAIAMCEDSGSIDSSGIQSAMEDLANKSQGQLPSPNSFFSIIGNRASNPSFITIAEMTAPAVAQEVVQGAVAVGNSVITAGSWLTSLFPVVAVGVVLFIVYSRTRTLAGK